MTGPEDEMDEDVNCPSGQEEEEAEGGCYSFEDDDYEGSHTESDDEDDE